MDVDPDGPSPAKKRKVMRAAEGFESTRRGLVKAIPPKFTSAFDNPKRSKLSSTDSPIRIPLPPIVHPHQTSKAGSVARPTRLIKPPTFSPMPGPSTKFTLKSHIPMSATRLGPTRQSDRKPVSMASIRKFQPALPAPFITKSAKAACTLKSLPPPPPLPRKPGTPDPRKLKTISTTRVAIALDPATENGSDELMALRLGQNASTYIPPAQRELYRGLGQSPEKASKSKTAKFIRGGLSERAQCIFTQQNTSSALWHKEMELQEQRPDAHPPVPPDLYLKVVQVIHVTAIASLQRSQNVPRLSVVRCAKIIKGREVGNVTVLLDFGCPGSAAAKVHTLDEVKVGRVVQLWPPWKSSDVQGEELCRNRIQPRDGTILFCTRFRIS